MFRYTLLAMYDVYLILFIAALTCPIIGFEYIMFGTIEWGSHASYNIATMNMGGNLVEMSKADYSGASTFELMVPDNQRFAYTLFGCNHTFISAYGLGLIFDLEHNSTSYYEVIPTAYTIYTIRRGNLVCVIGFHPRIQENFCMRYCGGNETYKCKVTTVVPGGAILATTTRDDEVRYSFTFTPLNVMTLNLTQNTAYVKINAATNYSYIEGGQSSFCVAAYGVGYWELISVDVSNISYACNASELAAGAACIAPSLYRCADNVIRTSCIKRVECVRGYYDYDKAHCICPSSYEGDRCENYKCFPVCLNGICASLNVCQCYTHAFYGKACEHYAFESALIVDQGIQFLPDSMVSFNLSSSAGSSTLIDVNNTIVFNDTWIRVSLQSYPVNTTDIVLFRAISISGNVTTTVAHAVDNRVLNCTEESVKISTSILQLSYVNHCNHTMPVYLPAGIAIGTAIYGAVILVISAVLVRYNKSFRKYVFPFRCTRKTNRRTITARPQAVEMSALHRQ